MRTFLHCEQFLARRLQLMEEVLRIILVRLLRHEALELLTPLPQLCHVLLQLCVFVFQPRLLLALRLGRKPSASSGGFLASGSQVAMDPRLCQSG